MITVMVAVGVLGIVAAHPRFHPDEIGDERGNVAFEDGCVAAYHILGYNFGLVVLVDD